MAKDTFNIIPKQKLDIPKWINPTVGCCVVLVLIVGGLYIYFSFIASSWEKKANVQLAEIISIETEENKSIEKKVGQISNKLEKFSEIFANKKRSFAIFDFLRNNCHPNVSFSNLNVNIATGDFALAGETDSYKSLSEQAIIFKELNEVSGLNISDISLAKEGNVSFKASFTLNPTYFKNK